MEEIKRWFIFVEYCKNGHRGIFCSRHGEVCVQDEEHTPDEMAEMVGMFWLILDPTSVALTEKELAEYTLFVPLAEYTNVWGIGFKKTEAQDDSKG